MGRVTVPSEEQEHETDWRGVCLTFLIVRGSRAKVNKLLRSASEARFSPLFLLPSMIFKAKGINLRRISSTIPDDWYFGYNIKRWANNIHSLQ